MAQYGFGAGSMWGMTTGNANPTPGKFGALQGASVDFTATTKELYGGYQLPLAVGRGTIKVDGKAQFAQIQSRQLADLFFGISAAAGQTLVSENEAGTIPATPYQITVANAATFVTDLGVRYTSSGIPLTRVASGPVTGQYSVSAVGVYTFAAADTTLAVKIDYTYTTPTTGGTITMTNQLIGTTPSYKAVLRQQFNGLSVLMQLNQCVASKYTFTTKLEDFNIPEFDYSAFVDSSNTLGLISVAEVS